MDQTNLTFIYLNGTASTAPSREVVHPFMADPREATDPLAILANQPVAVMLDFVDPQRAGGRSSHLRRQAWCDEAGGRRRWTMDQRIGQRRQVQPMEGSAEQVLTSNPLQQATQNLE